MNTQKTKFTFSYNKYTKTTMLTTSEGKIFILLHKKKKQIVNMRNQNIKLKMTIFLCK